MAVGVTLCVVSGIYIFSTEEHKDKMRQDLPYMRLRVKAFPWECSDCGFFEMDCWKACREKNAEKKH
jgi:hypothetical protein